MSRYKLLKEAREKAGVPYTKLDVQDAEDTAEHNYQPRNAAAYQRQRPRVPAPHEHPLWQYVIGQEWGVRHQSDTYYDKE